jgi:hypothetical protein
LSVDLFLFSGLFSHLIDFGVSHFLILFVIFFSSLLSTFFGGSLSILDTNLRGLLHLRGLFVSALDESASINALLADFLHSLAFFLLLFFLGG